MARARTATNCPYGPVRPRRPRRYGRRAKGPRRARARARLQERDQPGAPARGPRGRHVHAARRPRGRRHPGVRRRRARPGRRRRRPRRRLARGGRRGRSRRSAPTWTAPTPERRPGSCWRPAPPARASTASTPRPSSGGARWRSCSTPCAPRARARSRPAPSACPSRCGPAACAAARCVLPGDTSSQFLSALLMAAPLAREPLEVAVDGLVSRPYVDMTLRMMADFGVDAGARGHEASACPPGTTGARVPRRAGRLHGLVLLRRRGGDGASASRAGLRGATPCRATCAFSTSWRPWAARSVKAERASRTALRAVLRRGPAVLRASRWT